MQMFCHSAARMELLVVRFEKWLSRESVDEHRERVSHAVAGAAAPAKAVEVRREELEAEAEASVHVLI